MADKNIEAIYRLSPLQEGILFHTLETPESNVYFQQYSCTLEFLENPAAWQQAWADVTADHEVMRTLFTWDKRDHPLQIVRERVLHDWHIEDWRDSPQDFQAVRWQELLQSDRERGFDLATAPVMRFSLVRVGDNSYRFLWSFHHILLDGWSQRLICMQVFQAYRQQVNGMPVASKKAAQYGDFIRWLDTQDLDNARAFWSEQMRGLSRATLIADNAPASRSGIGVPGREVLEVTLEPKLYERLIVVGKQLQVTLNTLVAGAWALVLAANTRSSDLVFGSTVSGRSVDLAGADSISGLMINTLPLRVKVPDDAGVAEWLKALQSKQLAMRQFEQTPLVEIQKVSEIPAGTPLFDSILVFENVPETNEPVGTVTAPRVIEVCYTEYSHYPLALLAVPSESMTLIAVHQTDRIDSARASRLLEQLIFTLKQLCTAPDRSLGQISVIPEQERQLLLESWNQTGATFPEDRCIHQLFEERVRLHPGRVAIAFEDVEISFMELNQAANRLAWYLLEHGVQAGALVPVFMERGIDAIVAFLAVLKAGGAYIPIDSGLPTERIGQILEDIPLQRPLLLTQAALLEKVPVDRCTPVCPDRLQGKLSKFGDENPVLDTHSGDLAYLIYTSGSTGKPKGVMVEHRSLVNSTWARFNYYPEQPGCFLLLSSLAVDSSIAGLYWCLCGGGTLILPLPGLELDVEATGALVAKRQVTHILCIASLYQLILEGNAAEHLSSLSTVIVAGEACSGGIVEEHRRSLPGTRMYNEYGPSEATVWASVADLGDWLPGQPVPIGCAISNSTLYVLNEKGEPAPLGVPGELYVGGVGLARGYLNQPQATKAAFVEHLPVCSPNSPRLYKTGDLVRYREDGQLEFLGRVDNQVKVRGHRVEPEEIEQILSTHPWVGDIVVYVDKPDVDEAAEEALLKSMLASIPEATIEQLLLEVESKVQQSRFSKDTGVRG
jgi:amino acid adenylation domain-containing protein